MPRGDRTGPAGMGPMTGRAAGYCAGYPVPGYMNPAPGGGFWGRGRGGGGWGRRNRFYATGLTGQQRSGMGAAAFDAPGPVAPGVTDEQELEMLKAEGDRFEGALKEVNARIEQLDSEVS